MNYDIARSSVNGTAFTGTSAGNATGSLLALDYRSGTKFNATMGLWYSYRGADGIGMQSFMMLGVEGGALSGIAASLGAALAGIALVTSF